MNILCTNIKRTMMQCKIVTYRRRTFEGTGDRSSERVAESAAPPSRLHEAPSASPLNYRVLPFQNLMIASLWRSLAPPPRDIQSISEVTSM